MQTESLRDVDFKEGYIAVIDKPLEWTSTDVVRKIKFALQHRLGYKKIKIGHAGTLDPLATGVLIVCIGKATKMVNDLQAEEKEYIADIELGATTPSYDMEHPIDCRYPTDHITREAIEQVLRDLTGERLQAPPIYSAKKVEGVRAYEFARAGEEVELKKALINISTILSNKTADTWTNAFYIFHAHCSLVETVFYGSSIFPTKACNCKPGNIG
jgi:tRNA pseudouridine55 synthase